MMKDKPAVVAYAAVCIAITAIWGRVLFQLAQLVLR